MHLAYFTRTKTPRGKVGGRIYLHPGLQDNANKIILISRFMRAKRGNYSNDQASAFISALMSVIWSISKIQTSYMLHYSYFGFHISLIISKIYQRKLLWTIQIQTCIRWECGNKTQQRRIFICRCFWEEENLHWEMWSGLQNTDFVFFFPSEPALRHRRKCSLISEVTLLINVSMKKNWQMHFRESVIWVWGAAEQSVDTNFIHATPGFPMLLRNAHSFAVGLCKCSEQNTRGLHCLTELLRIKHRFSWSVGIRSGDEREWQMRAKEGPEWTGE